MSITLKQLAEAAGVSSATVSLALNGSPLVAEKTRTRVLELAGKLKYQPNLVARSLAGGSTRLLGVLLDSCAPRIMFQMLTLIEREAGGHGYRVMIGETHNNVEHLHQMYQTFRQYGADGIICLSHEYPGSEKALRKYFSYCPDMVFVGKPALENASYLTIDRSEAIREAVLHLHENGYRKIGLSCSGMNYESELAKMSAFSAALKELGVAAPEEFICRTNEDDIQERIRGVFSEYIRPGKLDAILAGNDSEAALLSKHLVREGMRIPDDFGIVGFDNERFCTFTTPELSSIDDLLELQARHVIRMLLEILNDKEESRIDRSVTVRSRLVVRGSSSRLEWKK